MNEKENIFCIEYDVNGCLTKLKNLNDRYEMNWVLGQNLWGTVLAPDGIQVRKEHRITERNTLEEQYVFLNHTDFPIYLKETDLGIVLQLADSYDDARTCMERRCHTHIWCGKEAAWIKAVRMSGMAPNLGLGIKKGSICSYSVIRDEKKLSNDRGSFVLHPQLKKLLPNETYEICWELFWYADDKDFADKLMDLIGIPVVWLEQATLQKGETTHFVVRGKGIPSDISFESDLQIR